MPSDTTTIFLGGDVMTGRGVDQILRSPASPELHEEWVRDARDYVLLAENASGAIPRPADDGYVWGELADELGRIAPAARIVNLETSITARGEPWPGKPVCYRMSPSNVGCLTAARLDVCTLANNHVLDYGAVGLEDTLETLARAGIALAGAGTDELGAQRPARIPRAGGGDVVVLAIGCEDSGIPTEWAARAERGGVDLLPDLTSRSIAQLCDRVRAIDRAGDLVVVSIHWGGNWGDHVPSSHVELAHRVIDAGCDVVHGHSSHHPRAIEVHGGRPIFYGCGDLLNDYEGIRGHEAYRPDLALAYFAELDRASGALVSLVMQPLRIHKLRLERASHDDAEWLADRLDRVCERFGTRIVLRDDARLALRWS
ncbi:CapA family protein [Sandaracinus amylolyticus]|uniref:CapA family protein n=1 Tax=Sandaracinus amylolyticus TaxID=927083 RepID=UPI001F316CAB|nr:CapA family protein [Sandaracinus amylolyticus]UJR84645.1 Hypothetical protein I5071_67240 [Sandaracinus amylolyticus]